MDRTFPFCGQCGVRYSSGDDQYCRICGRSANDNLKKNSSSFRWSWRFLLIIPAFVTGIIVPGMLIRISTELAIPAGDSLFLPVSEIAQSLTDGACAVLFPRAVAPRAKLGTSLGAGILLMVILGLFIVYSFATNYYADVGTGAVVWQVVLIVTMGLAAGIAMLYAQIQSR